MVLLFLFVTTEALPYLQASRDLPLVASAGRYGGPDFVLSLGYVMEDCPRAREKFPELEVIALRNSATFNAWDPTVAGFFVDFRPSHVAFRVLAYHELVMNWAKGLGIFGLLIPDTTKEHPKKANHNFWTLQGHSQIRTSSFDVNRRTSLGNKGMAQIVYTKGKSEHSLLKL